MYNHLLDNEFNFIKKVYFPNAWKIGIAFSEFFPTRISYIIYQISKGENGLLIRQIPIEEFLKIKSFVFASRNLAENAIYINPKKFAFKLIQDNIIKFLKEKKVFLITEEIAIEYIFDFINRNYRILKIEKQKNAYNLDKLNLAMEELTKSVILQIKSINNLIPVKDLDKYFTSHETKHNAGLELYIKIESNYKDDNDEFNSNDDSKTSLVIAIAVIALLSGK